MGQGSGRALVNAWVRWGVRGYVNGCVGALVDGWHGGQEWVRLVDG